MKIKMKNIEIDKDVEPEIELILQTLEKLFEELKIIKTQLGS